jgi:cation-transporting ATPase I
MLRQAFGATARLPLRAARLPGAAMRTVVTALGSRPVHRTVPGHSHIPVRGVRAPGAESFAKALQDTLTGLAGVSRAEVNGVLGHVLVVHDAEVRAPALVAAVEDVERRYGVGRAPFTGAAHPADGQAILREAALAAADLAGCGLAVTGRVLRAVPLPPGVPAALALADAAPPLRGALERRIGRPAAEFFFGAGAAVTHALSQQPTGPLLDFAHRAMLLAELAAADVGIGTAGGPEHPAWDAHVLCGPGLGDACLVLDAMPRARDVSRRSARIAGIGSAAGARARRHVLFT